MTRISDPRTVPEAQAAVRRLCELQSLVSAWVFDYRHPADCFCGEGGFWPLPTENSYRNEMKSIEFIEEAVKAAIAELRTTP